jgi:type I restriction enzyme S subunit
VTLRTRTLGEICDEVDGIIQTGPFGSQLHESDYVAEGVPVIMPKNIIDGRIDTAEIAYIGNDDAERLQRHKLEKGDIVYGRRGDIGRRGLIGPREKGWLCGTGCLRISLGERVVDPTFLYYYLGQPQVVSWIANQAIGATMPNLNTGILRSVEIQYPHVRVQRLIASILSAYDDLIENNIRRIKILEEMAQMLYREWFVNFRFPGHENVRMVESELGPLPEGWSVQPMNNVAEVIDCLHSKKPQAVQYGPGLLLQLSNISDGGKLDLTNRFRISQDQYDLWTSRIELRQGDCVVPNIGRIGAASQIPAGINAALGRDLTAIRPKVIGPTYLIEYLMSPYMTTEIALKKDSRVIMEVLNVKGIVRVRVPVPTRDVLDRFEDNARPMRRRIELLVAQNRNLRTTRDLLLPKLISGEIPVEAADETAAELEEEIALHA